MPILAGAPIQHRRMITVASRHLMTAAAEKSMLLIASAASSHNQATCYLLPSKPVATSPENRRDWVAPARMGESHQEESMESVRVVIAKPLAPKFVEQLRAAVPEIEVVDDQSLLPQMRWPADHCGDPAFKRTAEQQARFEEMIDSADILYGIPDESPASLARTIRANPKLRWVQAMAAGAGAALKAADLTPEELERVTMTTSAGVHATPLAEFAVMGVLAGAKNLPKLIRDKQNHYWDQQRSAMRSIKGMRVVVVGMGSIGRECAKDFAALGATVIGVNRSIKPVDHIEKLYTSDQIVEAATGADVLINALPGAVGTEKLISRETLEALAPGAIIASIGRGHCVDEEALIDLLKSGHIGFAALDVVAHEPLDASSPLWDLDNVLISPHCTTIVDTQDAEIMELFIGSLQKFLNGERPANVVDTKLFY